MGDIRAFLQPPVTEERHEVIISKRFKGADGKPAPFVLRAIDPEINNKITKQCTKQVIKNGVSYPEVDSEMLSKKLILACVVEPDFRDAKLCEYYKTVDPLDVPGRMLTIGEYNRLFKEIRNICGMAEDTEAEVEEAKN
jgi:hypothetical protein